MGATIYFENIQRYFFLYADLLEQSNGVGLTDKAVHAENLLAGILNTVFGWTLENANEYNVVQDSFDLHDEQNKVYVQVTANKSHRKKYDSTVDSFTALNQYKYSKLVVLFISRKVTPKIPRKKQAGGVVIELLDVPGLLRKILYKCKHPADLKSINEALQITLMPVLINIPLNNPLVRPAADIRIIPDQVSSGFYIKRLSLIKDIYAFIEKANGLLVGGPGFGKSFILEELRRYCVAREIPCYIIKINELIGGDNTEISEELKFTGDWLNSLSTIRKGNRDVIKGILIFDAFDTAKDERLKGTILKQIRRSINELGGWRTIVSVRTYDASKSSRLLELFPNDDIKRDITCRYIAIPELTEDELELAFKSIAGSHKSFAQLKPEMRKLLRTPYFLKIYESLLASKSASMKDVAIDSEAQLLTIFWRKKVEESGDYELFLRRLTELLSHNERLVCDKSKILNEHNVNTFASLVSLGIIEETSITRQRISFTHNILLDFAIAKYLLKDDLGQQLNYIDKNEKQPFIFRQSFVYFYSELWRADRNLFWQHYHAIADVKKPLFRLFHQTILNFVLISVYESTDDLLPLLDEADTEKSGPLIRKALEAIRFIAGNDIRFKDVVFISKLSHHMHWSYLWEVGGFIERAIAHYQKQAEKKLMKIISDAACEFLAYILTERKTFPNKAFIDGNGSYRGVKNLCDTYIYNKTRSKALVLLVMQIMKEEDFPINFFHTLSENILSVFTTDPKFGTRLYLELYEHNEVSDKETFWGGSAIMGLRSNRKQDYNMIHHRLEENFSKMLELNYESAMPVGFRILNAAGRDKYSYRDKVSFPIKIGEVETVLNTDYYYFDEDDRYGPFVHAKVIFNYLDKLGKEHPKGVILKAKITETLPHLKAGKFWGKMLTLLKTYPESLYPIASQILAKSAIYQSEDTIYEAGELIGAIWSFCSEGQRRAIETAINGIDTAISYYSNDSVENMKIRMLSCIPEGSVLLGKSSKLMANNPRIDNKPKPYSGPTVAEARFHTKEEKILHAGFDLNRPDDVQVYKSFEKIELFNEHFEKNQSAVINTLDYEILLPNVLELFERSAADAYWNDQLKYSCDIEVAKFAAQISSTSNLSAEIKDLILRIALTFLESPTYISGVFKVGSTDRSWLDLYPNARTKSVLSFFNIMLLDNDPAMQSYFLSLMNDTSKHVRLKAIRSLTYFWHHDRPAFWKKVHEVILTESDTLCLLESLRSIHFDNIIESDLAEMRIICDSAVHRLKGEEDKDARDLWQTFAVIVIKLLLRYDTVFATKLIIENTDSKEFCRNLTFEITNIVDPHDTRNEDPGVLAGNEILFDTLVNIARGQFIAIAKKGISSGQVSAEFEIIDHIIQHVFFALSNGKAKERKATITDVEQREYFEKIRPLIDYVLEASAQINSGFMAAHTGYYFMQLMNHLLYLDPAYVLKSSASIVEYSAKNNFTYDGSTLKEIVKLTESILADHKYLLVEKQSFDSLLLILDLFINSGWQEALELTWRLKDVF